MLVGVALLECKARGLTIDPKLAVGDGALGFWKALRQVYPTTREQRCWVHKTANVLDKLPKRLQAKAKEMLHDVWQAATRADAEKAFDLFVATYEAKYPKASECLNKDRAETAGVLRLSGRALGALADHEPHRVGVRQCAATNGQDVEPGGRFWMPGSLSGH